MIFRVLEKETRLLISWTYKCQDPPKHQKLFTNRHGILSQKTWGFILN